jgi:Domain of unknown function (DUF4351)
VPEELLEVRNMLAARAENWKQPWLQEGRQEGRQEGEAALLARQLERRFGALPGWAKDRIATADIVALEWGLRIDLMAVPSSSWFHVKDVASLRPFPTHASRHVSCPTRLWRRSNVPW